MADDPGTVPAPLRPDAVRNLDQLATYLRFLRTSAGSPSYPELTRRVNAIRSAAASTSQASVYRCFQQGRTRVDTELAVDLAVALGLDAAGQTLLRQALQVAAGEAEAASLVDVRAAIPEPSPRFVGRRRQLEELASRLRAAAASETAPTAAIVGPAGTGKTQLALAAAHCLLAQGRCHDVQFFVDLGGYDVDRPPADPMAVLAELLRALGVSPDRIHSRRDLAGRRELLHTKLSGRSALLVLDNAADAEHVAPLLPGLPRCPVLITSRRRFDGPDQPSSLTLGAFTSAEATELLRDFDPHGRIAAEPQDADRLAIGLCGGMPLDLTALGARLSDADESHWSLSDHIARLESFPRDEVSRPALAATHERLSSAAQRAFRLSALHPGRDFTVHDLAALSAGTWRETVDVVEELVSSHLLSQRADGRLDLHDAVRAFADRLLRQREPAGRQREASDRLERLQCAALAAAKRVCAPHITTALRPELPDNTAPLPEFAEAAQARAWMDAERGNLIAAATKAAAQGRGDRAVVVSMLLGSYLDETARWSESERLLSTSLPHTVGAAKAHHLLTLGVIYNHLSQLERSESACVEALEISRETGDDTYVGFIYGTLGNASLRLGEPKKAAARHGDALRIFRRQGNVDAQSVAVNNLGNAWKLLGDYRRAVQMFDKAIELARECGSKGSEAPAVGNLGLVRSLAGEFDHAVALQRRALQLCRDAGHVWGECFALTYLGTVLNRAGQCREAEQTLREAVALAESLDRPQSIAEAVSALGAVEHRLRLWDEAEALQRRALEACADATDAPLRSQVHNRLGCVLTSLGRIEESEAEHREALRLAEGVGDRLQAAYAHDGLAEALESQAETQAAEHRQTARRELADMGVVPVLAVLDAE